MTDMIFVLEDDDGIRNLMLYTLNAAGFEAAGFADSGPFWVALSQSRPDLALLDIMLPGEDGISVLKKLRGDPATADLPVIMATAKGAEYDKVLGLNLGADDYLAKPFGMLEMISRVKAVLRRTERKSRKNHAVPDILRAGGLEVNTISHTVAVQGKRVQLTLKEYELLRAFLCEPNRVFTRDELIADIWETEFTGETRTVDVHVRTLRAKLGPCGDLIKTVRGVGYMLEAEK